MSLYISGPLDDYSMTWKIVSFVNYTMEITVVIDNSARIGLSEELERMNIVFNNITVFREHEYFIW